MKDCTKCCHAQWDYEEFYGTTKKRYFVCGCKKDEEPEECEEYEEHLES